MDRLFKTKNKVRRQVLYNAEKKKRKKERKHSKEEREKKRKLLGEEASVVPLASLTRGRLAKRVCM